VDKLGLAFEERAVATGFGSHLALPILRTALAEYPDLTRDQAVAILNKCIEVLYYRDARSYATVNTFSTN
jgi:20S proteasome subunit beta 7